MSAVRLQILILNAAIKTDFSLTLKSPSPQSRFLMKSKVMGLEKAIERFVKDGSVVCLGGILSLIHI